ILEYESLSQSSQYYYDEDFIISTLVFAKDDPQIIYPSIKKLIELGAAGMAVKSAYFKSLPKDVLQLANNKMFPIFMFEDLYIEEVIISITEYIRERQQIGIFERQISRLLYGKTDVFLTEQYAVEMNPGRREAACCLFMQVKDSKLHWIHKIKDALLMRSNRAIADQYRFLQYKRGFFVISNLYEPESQKQIKEDFSSVFRRLGCSLDGIHAGISTVKESIAEFDCMLQEALDAYLYGNLFDRNVSIFDEIGIYRFLFPIYRDKGSRRIFDGMKQAICEYDTESSGDLQETLLMYLKENQDIRKTAEKMNQHANTIRYRLGKIAELTGCHTGVAEKNQLFLLGEYIRFEHCMKNSACFDRQDAP
ncbi:MAG TPA: helix-turn-helix domain-containing protein, partial [Lachnospiraceae bacterium]|nr:helix-turn-helix domain-containing protein [Lachnospiraceae bacterium]